MFNPITSFHNFLKDQRIDSTFFKGILLVPVIGLTTQIWKTLILRSEIQAVKLDEVSIDSDEGKRRYNKCAKKVTRLCNLGFYSLNRGKWGDTVYVIAGTLCPYKILRFSLMSLGMASLGTRLFIHYHADWALKDEIKSKRPAGKYIYDGYSVII